jgi:hypothetical protein
MRTMLSETTAPKSTREVTSYIVTKTTPFYDATGYCGECLHESPSMMAVHECGLNAPDIGLHVTVTYKHISRLAPYSLNADLEDLPF